MAAKMTYDKAHIIVNICNKYIQSGQYDSVKAWKADAEIEVRGEFPEFDNISFESILKRMHGCLARKAWKIAHQKKVTN